MLLVHVCTLLCSRTKFAYTWLKAHALSLAFSLSTIFYPLVANTVFRLLNCQQVQVTLGRYQSMDGGAGTAASFVGSRNGNVTVAAASFISVNALLSDSDFVCYEGSHAGIAPLAWITLFFFCIGYPSLSLLWAQRRLSLVVAKIRGTGSEAQRETTLTAGDSQGQMSASTLSCSRSPSAPLPSTALQCIIVSLTILCCGRRLAVKVLSQGGCVLDKDTSAALTASASEQDFLDESLEVKNDASLKYFVGESRRPSGLSATAVDLLTLGFVASLWGGWSISSFSTRSEVFIRGCFCALAFCTSAWYYCTRKVFPQGEEWQWMIKASSLVIAALSSILVAVSQDVALSAPPSDLLHDVQYSLSVCVFLLTCLLIISMVIGFALTSIRGAKKEVQKAKEDIAKAAEIVVDKLNNPMKSIISLEGSASPTVNLSRALRIERAAAEQQQSEGNFPARDSTSRRLIKTMSESRISAFSAKPVKHAQGGSDLVVKVEDGAFSPVYIRREQRMR